MKYALKKFEKGERETKFKVAFQSLRPLLHDETRALTLAGVAISINSVVNLLAPFIIARTIDTYIATKNFHGVLILALILGIIYLCGLVTGYLQVKIMGGVGRRVLFKLRNAIFTKLQELPVAFFNANQAGDLISRINNDTDKLNQFFSQALVQFAGNTFLMLGAGIFLVSLHWSLGIAALIPAALVLIITQIISAWIRITSLRSLQSVGGLSGEVQESLANFKVIVAFNRLDYFRKRFSEVNEINYLASIKAGIASNILTPIYGIASNIAQVVVLAYGIILIVSGHLTIGLLIGFLLYVNNFYTPLRQLASIWSSLQLALASIDRISEVLKLESNITLIDTGKTHSGNHVIVFEHVSFSYDETKEIFHDINLALDRGKTYALVGPTGGGKTTTASLMARLYDPTGGTIYLDGTDIRSIPYSERAQKIGFILQEPFLFTGTVHENIVYGNDLYMHTSSEALEKVLIDAGLDSLLVRFEKGLATSVGGGDSISLGQKQLIAFMRAVLRKPEILILDEATANIDTVTEQLLEDILRKLPSTTTKVIIAHRLNTIENADDIFFVNAGAVIHAGDFNHALEMLMSGKRTS